MIVLKSFYWTLVLFALLFAISFILTRWYYGSTIKEDIKSSTKTSLQIMGAAGTIFGLLAFSIYIYNLIF